ncbi:MAG: proline dehydrogenase family protein [Planctomycetes bacterium]|nr:proline dehydrogenase family protein [Planctomycetota bacterium]
MVLARLHDKALEADIGRIGREIFKRAESAAPSIFSMEAWQQFAMNWMTQDEDLKLRLFRFIEVMPSLKDSTAIARHLDEYLRPHESNGHSTDRSWPPIIDLAVSFRRHDSAYAKLVAWAAMYGCGQSARHFIVGATPAEAIASVRKLRRKGMTFTLDVLGETIIADRVALHHQEIYLNLLRHLGRESREWPDLPVLDHAPWGPLPKVNISIKLSAIVAKFDPIDPEGAARAALDRLRPVLRCARETGAFINVDMEHYAVKDLTLDIFKRVLTEPEFRDWANVGIVIQTYMPEGERDMRELIEWTRSRGTPITVRIVKGAYWDSETANAKKNRWPNPLYEEKWESDASFERVSELLLRNADVIRPAFASHNVRSIAAVLAMESALGLPPRTLELQMLTGMGDQLKRAVVSMGQRLRVYAPCGDLMTGMAYLIRRLIENTANESFLRQSFGQQVPIDRLLAKPGTARLENSESRPVPSSKATSEQDADSFVTSADIDFSREANRQAMRKALAEVRSQFGRKHPAIIGNGGVDTRIWHDSLNPSIPAEVVGRTAICDHTLADRGVHAAREALHCWSSTTPSERAAVFKRAAMLLDERRFELCAWMTMEVGKTWRESQGDFMEAADYLAFYAHEMERAGTRPFRNNTAENADSLSQFPMGVAVVIAPFTSPLSQPCSMIAGALSAGATVVFKPAGDASVCGAKLCEILIEAGLPPGVLNYVPGSGSDLGDFLVVHPGVDAIAFTGSTKVGRRVIERAHAPVDGRVAQK